MRTRRGRGGRAGGEVVAGCSGRWAGEGAMGVCGVERVGRRKHGLVPTPEKSTRPSDAAGTAGVEHTLSFVSTLFVTANPPTSLPFSLFTRPSSPSRYTRTMTALTHNLSSLLSDTPPRFSLAHRPPSTDIPRARTSTSPSLSTHTGMPHSNSRSSLSALAHGLAANKHAHAQTTLLRDAPPAQSPPTSTRRPLRRSSSAVHPFTEPSLRILIPLTDANPNSGADDTNPDADAAATTGAPTTDANDEPLSPSARATARAALLRRQVAAIKREHRSLLRSSTATSSSPSSSSAPKAATAAAVGAAVGAVATGVVVVPVAVGVRGVARVAKLVTDFVTGFISIPTPTPPEPRVQCETLTWPALQRRHRQERLARLRAEGRVPPAHALAPDAQTPPWADPATTATASEDAPPTWTPPPRPPPTTTPHRPPRAPGSGSARWRDSVASMVSVVDVRGGRGVVGV
ncbi:hypothetical protein M427DRAFT_38381 [Gonapodya prolifera JEL478]|uniref:Uncharacterized protein n=1 Tax=Gonapodya prolifera (strain JEL478) TaxID=1344416 RepID=A0A138ZZ06_GONPJ|nr:hypothetical protein M427DRAFT_38381 [Gonapodya prolifera JEL478]|eukprot:KXS09739.1 hypothetical protein M427DRAFT_38381 [Gonapodya prolifera JEL478]